MQAFLIFLAGALLLALIGYFYPSKTNKTPQNSQDKRQGNSTEWAQSLIDDNRSEKK